MIEEIQIQQYEKEGGSIIGELRAIQVVDQETHDLAAEVLTKRAAWKKKVIEFFAPMKKKAYDAWKEIVAKETEVLDGKDGVNKSAEEATRDSLAAWENERKRLQQQLDLEAAEKQKKIDDEARETAAQHAKALGAGEEAVQQIREAQLPVSPPKTAPTYRRSSGVSTTEKWTWRYASTPQASLSALVKAAAKNPALLGLLQINVPALDSKARTEKSAAVVPGIVFYSVTKTSVRAAK